MSTLHTKSSATLPRWMKPREAAVYGNISVGTIYHEVAAGRLRAARLCGRRSLRLKREWIDEWMTAQVEAA